MRDELSLQLVHHLLVAHNVSWLLLASASPVEIRKLHVALHPAPGGPGPKPSSGPGPKSSNGGIWQDGTSEELTPGQ